MRFSRFPTVVAPALLTLALPTLALTSCGGSSDDQASAPPSIAPRVIGYAGGESPGVFVEKPAQVRKLQGAPQDFTTFIAGLVSDLVEQSTCEGGAVGVTVESVRTDGFATGGVNDCGGYAALWAKVDGAWKEIGGTQEMWHCDLLEKYAVPSDIAGDTCFDEQTQKARTYDQA